MNHSIETRQNMITGLTLIAICAGLFFFTFAYDKQVSKGAVYYASFKDVTGLKPGNPVKLNGVVSGFVESMKVLENKAQLKLRISPGVFLYKGASVGLRNKTFLGGRFIELEAGEQSAGRLQNGSSLLVMDSPVNPEELLEVFGRSLPKNGHLSDELSIAYKLASSLPEKADRLSLSYKQANKLLESLNTLKARLKAVRKDLRFDKDFKNVPTDFINRLDEVLSKLDLLGEKLGHGSLQNIKQQTKDLVKKFELIASTISRLSKSETKVLENLDHALIVLLAYDELLLRKLMQDEGFSPIKNKSEINKRIKELEDME